MPTNTHNMPNTGGKALKNRTGTCYNNTGFCINNTSDLLFSGTNSRQYNTTHTGLDLSSLYILLMFGLQLDLYTMEQDILTFKFPI